MLFTVISDSLKCQIYHKETNFENTDIRNITAGDLMSEVLVVEHEHVLLVTALNSEQVLRTASMVDALGVVLVNAKVPGAEMISLAKDLGITLLSTSYSLFDTCAVLSRLMEKED